MTQNISFLGVFMLKTFRIYFLLAVFFLICGLISHAEPGKDFFDEGIKAFEQGKFQVAVDMFSVLIDQDPSNAKIYKNRGVAYMGLKYYESAINDLERAIELDPELEGVYSNLGAVWHYKKDYAKAIENYNIEISKRPDIHSTYFNRAISKTELHNYTGALEDLALAIDLKPDSYWTLACKGDIHMKLNQVQMARESYERAVRLDPGNIYAKNKLSELDEMQQAGKKGLKADLTDNMLEGSLEDSREESLEDSREEFLEDSREKPVQSKEETIKEDTIKDDKGKVKNQETAENFHGNKSEKQAGHADPDRAKLSAEKQAVSVTVDGGAYTVQTGAFLIEENAQEMFDELKKKGFVPRIFRLTGKNDRHWHMVRIGRFKTMAEAEIMRRSIMEKHGMDAVVSRVGRF